MLTFIEKVNDSNTMKVQIWLHDLTSYYGTKEYIFYSCTNFAAADLVFFHCFILFECCFHQYQCIMIMYVYKARDWNRIYRV